MAASNRSRVKVKKKATKSRTGGSALSFSRFSKKQLMIAGILVVFLGIFVAFFAFAASPSQTEPESWSKSEQRAAGNMNGCVETVNDPSASDGKYIQFGCSEMPVDHTMDCTPGIGSMSAMGPCINNALIPAAQAGVSGSKFFSTATTPSTMGSSYDSFRTRCDFSHMNYDDPLLYLNQPNRAHLHAFFGNSNTNASSTSQSLRNTGNSTCASGTFNRSAYWVPAMIDSSNGRPITPNDDRGSYNSDLEIYYKIGYQGIGYDSIEPFPEGFQMIAGNSANATTASPAVRGGKQPVHYYCESSAPDDRTRGREALHIPVCTSGEVLVMHIIFPQCWDGVNLSSTNGRSHVEYGIWNGDNLPNTPIGQSTGCPSTHPKSLLGVEMFVRYRVPQGTDTRNWRLSSDNYTNGPGGYSGHADYIFAWDPAAFPTIVQRCASKLRDCGYTLGDGRDLVTIRYWNRNSY
jgi:hypothetical protein